MCIQDRSIEAQDPASLSLMVPIQHREVSVDCPFVFGVAGVRMHIWNQEYGVFGEIPHHEKRELAEKDLKMNFSGRDCAV